MEFVSSLPYEEARRRLGDKTVVAAGLAGHDWQSIVPVGLRDRAFFSSRIANARFLNNTKSLLSDFLTGACEQVASPDGRQSVALKVGSRAEFVARAREFAILNGLESLVDPRDRGGP